MPDAHLVSVEFAIPSDLPAGTCRIRHTGHFKTKSDPELHGFTATSRPLVFERQCPGKGEKLSALSAISQNRLSC